MALLLRKIHGHFNGEIHADEGFDFRGRERDKDIRNSKSYHEAKQLPKHELERIRRAITLAHNDNFRRRRSPKYGSLPRCFSKDQLTYFFSCVRNPIIKKGLLIQFFFALRPSEVCSVEFYPSQRIVRIHNTKCDRIDFLPLYEPVLSWLCELSLQRRHSQHYMRKCFSKIRKDSGFDFVYDTSDSNRPLYQFTQHSLRHTAIMLFDSLHCDLYKRNAFARHSPGHEIGVHATYMHYSFESLREDMRRAFFDVFEKIV